MRSIVGVGITPPKVLGTPNPASSVMISSTLGASLGGTIRGAHQGLDCRAASLITPPNLGAGAGSCSPLMDIVALGEPSTPLIFWASTGNHQKPEVTTITRDRIPARIDWKRSGRRRSSRDFRFLVISNRWEIMVKVVECQRKHR